MFDIKKQRVELWLQERPWEKCGRVVRKGKTYNYAELKSPKSYSIMTLYIGNTQAMEIS